MTTKNKTTKNKSKSKSKSTAKKTVKKTQVITDKELEETLTEPQNEVTVETQPIVDEPVSVPAEIQPREYKLQRMVELLLSPEGASLKELAEELGWLENSVRGALSAYTKKHPEYTLISEKVEGVRIYHLKLKLFA